MPLPIPDIKGIRVQTQIPIYDIHFQVEALQQQKQQLPYTGGDWTVGSTKTRQICLVVFSRTSWKSITTSVSSTKCKFALAFVTQPINVSRNQYKCTLASKQTHKFVSVKALIWGSVNWRNIWQLANGKRYVDSYIGRYKLLNLLAVLLGFFFLWALRVNYCIKWKNIWVLDSRCNLTLQLQTNGKTYRSNRRHPRLG